MTSKVMQGAKGRLRVLTSCPALFLFPSSSDPSEHPDWYQSLTQSLETHTNHVF